MIRIFGFGTLVLLESALLTCPGLKNFSPAVVKNSVRVFGKVNLRAAYRGDVDWDTMEVASCFIEERQGSEVVGVTFDIPVSEWPLMRAREIDYDCRRVDVFDQEGNPQGTAITFFGYPTDADFMKNMSDGDQEYLEKRRKGYQGEMYRDGIYPGEDYLKKCFWAHERAGDVLRENFLHHSLLSDRKTTVGQYLEGKKNILL